MDIIDIIKLSLKVFEALQQNNGTITLTLEDKSKKTIRLTGYNFELEYPSKTYIRGKELESKEIVSYSISEITDIN